MFDSSTKPLLYIISQAGREYSLVGLVIAAGLNHPCDYAAQVPVKDWHAWARRRAIIPSDFSTQKIIIMHNCSLYQVHMKTRYGSGVDIYVYSIYIIKPSS